jgi:hypothetical protein
MRKIENTLKKLTKEEFDDRIIQVVKIGIRTWERRKIIIEEDNNFSAKTYQKVPEESGLVCSTCVSRGVDDPLKLDHIFKAINEAWATGDKKLLIAAIDAGLKATRDKVKEVYGVDL